MEFKLGDKVKCVKRIQLPHDSMNYAEKELKIGETYIIDVYREAGSGSWYNTKDTVMLKGKKYEHDINNFVKVNKRKTYATSKKNKKTL